MDFFYIMGMHIVLRLPKKSNDLNIAEMFERSVLEHLHVDKSEQLLRNLGL